MTAISFKDDVSRGSQADRSYRAEVAAHDDAEDGLNYGQEAAHLAAVRAGDWYVSHPGLGCSC